jgi:mRNA-degrading endonuclease toxin of MazEF toxin-antitoxin module
VEVGVDEGLKGSSCVNLVNVFTVRQSELTRYVGSVAPRKMHAICRALAIACDCD